MTIARQLDGLGAASTFGELATQGRPEAAVLRIPKDEDRGGQTRPALGGYPAAAWVAGPNPGPIP